MKAVPGYTKDDYRKAPVVLDFSTIAAAAEYLAQKYNQSIQDMEAAILNDTNCDAIYFDDGSVILNESI